MTEQGIGKVGQDKARQHMKGKARQRQTIGKAGWDKVSEA